MQRVEEYRNALFPDLVSCASVDAAMATAGWTPVVPAGARWRFFRGSKEPSPGLEWTAAEFDDASWDLGPSSFGYGHNDLATVLDMAGKFATLYTRHALSSRTRKPQKISGSPFRRMMDSSPT